MQYAQELKEYQQTEAYQITSAKIQDKKMRKGEGYCLRQSNELLCVEMWLLLLNLMFSVSITPHVCLSNWCASLCMFQRPVLTCLNMAPQWQMKCLVALSFNGNLYFSLKQETKLCANLLLWILLSLTCSYICLSEDTASVIVSASSESSLSKVNDSFIPY